MSNATDFTATIMNDEGTDLVDVDIRDLDTDRLLALRAEAANAGDHSLQDAIAEVLGLPAPAVFAEVLVGGEWMAEDPTDFVGGQVGEFDLAGILDMQAEIGSGATAARLVTSAGEVVAEVTR